MKEGGRKDKGKKDDITLLYESKQDGLTLKTPRATLVYMSNFKGINKLSLKYKI